MHLRNSAVHKVAHKSCYYGARITSDLKNFVRLEHECSAVTPNMDWPGYHEGGETASQLISRRTGAVCSSPLARKGEE